MTSTLQKKQKPKPKLEQESGLWPIFCWTSPNGPSSILDGWFFGIHVQFWSHSPARLTFCGKVIAPWRAGRKKVWLSLDDPSWYTQFEKYALVKIGNLPPKKRCKHPEITNISSEMSVHSNPAGKEKIREPLVSNFTSNLKPPPCYET